MSTKDQYEFFKLQFGLESDRNVSLTKKAEVYLSIISLLLTGFIFKLSDLKLYAKSNFYILMVIIVTLFSIFGSALLVILSIQIKDYKAALIVSDWPDELGDAPLTDSDFFLNRITDFITVTPVNAKINNKKGQLLLYAGYCLLMSIISIGVFIFLIIFL